MLNKAGRTGIRKIGAVTDRGTARRAELIDYDLARSFGQARNSNYGTA